MFVFSYQKWSIFKCFIVQREFTWIIFMNVVFNECIVIWKILEFSWNIASYQILPKFEFHNKSPFLDKR